MSLVMAFVVGACVGSFLNVCILRIPAGESVVWPVSHCRACARAIAWYDNIPCVSYFWLKARCRHCQAPFSRQYVVIEFLTAFLSVLFLLVFGLTAKGFFYWALSLGLLVESVIDLRHQIIPDGLTLPGIAAGLLASSVFPGLQDQRRFWEGLLASGAGVLVGGGFLYVLGTLAEWFLKKEAMGGGDVKLLAMIGAFLGVTGVIWTIFTASLFGSAVGIYLRLKKNQQVIPFGPFLGLGAFSYLFFGPALVNAYLRMIG